MVKAEIVVLRYMASNVPELCLELNFFQPLCSHFQYTKLLALNLVHLSLCLDQNLVLVTAY